jgi:hypothetical protein
MLPPAMLSVPEMLFKLIPRVLLLLEVMLVNVEFNVPLVKFSAGPELLEMLTLPAVRVPNPELDIPLLPTPDVVMSNPRSSLLVLSVTPLPAALPIFALKPAVTMVTDFEADASVLPCRGVVAVEDVNGITRARDILSFKQGFKWTGKPSVASAGNIILDKPCFGVLNADTSGSEF